MWAYLIKGYFNFSMCVNNFYIISVCLLSPNKIVLIPQPGTLVAPTRSAAPPHHRHAMSAHINTYICMQGWVVSEAFERLNSHCNSHPVFMTPEWVLARKWLPKIVKLAVCFLLSLQSVFCIIKLVGLWWPSIILNTTNTIHYYFCLLTNKVVNYLLPP